MENIMKLLKSFYQHNIYKKQMHKLWRMMRVIYLAYAWGGIY